VYVLLLTDHHQAFSTMFLKQGKNVIHIDSPDIIFTAWDPTRYNFGHSVAGIM